MTMGRGWGDEGQGEATFHEAINAVTPINRSVRPSILRKVTKNAVCRMKRLSVGHGPRSIRFTAEAKKAAPVGARPPTRSLCVREAVKEALPAKKASLR